MTPGWSEVVGVNTGKPTHCGWGKRREDAGPKWKESRLTSGSGAQCSAEAAAMHSGLIYHERDNVYALFAVM